MRWAILWLCGLLIAASCTRARSEIIVTVRSDLAPGTLQSVVITVRRGGPEGMTRGDLSHALDDSSSEWTLPLTFVTYPEDETSHEPVWIEVLGCHSADRCGPQSAVAAQRALVAYLPGQIAELDLNPVFVRRAGVAVADARVVLR